MKEWKRGTPLSAAKQIFEVKEDDIRADCFREFDHEKKRDFCVRGIDFEHRELFSDPREGKDASAFAREVELAIETVDRGGDGRCFGGHALGALPQRLADHIDRCLVQE